MSTLNQTYTCSLQEMQKHENFRTKHGVYTLRVIITSPRPFGAQDFTIATTYKAKKTMTITSKIAALRGQLS